MPGRDELLLPDKLALCMAENAPTTCTTCDSAGAQFRDPRIWSRYLAEAIELFAQDCDVAFASHHWPTWGTDEIVAFWPSSGTCTPIFTTRPYG